MVLTRIVAISDTHGLHREVILPKADILLHCGDFTNIGELPVLEDFNNWLGEQDQISHKIVIAGNHDRCFESKKQLARNILSNARYLENEGLNIMGLNIWGSPITSTLPFWAFAYTDEQTRYNVWEKMPKDLDILMTHTPPHGILDGAWRTEYDSDERYKESVGDRLLNAYIIKNKPKYNIFGHIHESFGFMESENTKFYNVSQVNEIYRIVNKPVIITI